jgi:ribosomal protein S18 acetylase RimI-like enzyme
MNATMSVNYSIRTVLSRDAISLHDTCWPERSLDAIRELLYRVDGLTRKGRGLGIVAEIEGHAVAYAQLTHWPRVAEISDLIIAPQYRNQGIGTALIHHLLEHARYWRTAHVEIGVAASNLRAFSLYKRLGFEENRTITLDVGNGEESVTYLSMPIKHP